jgi:SAM-dependent methyltransferase
MSFIIPANVNRFMGFADDYDAYRPSPPQAFVDLLCQIAGADRPRVVDIGCGTGLSSRIWAGRASSIIGIEPSDDMRRQAEAASVGLIGGETIHYQAGSSSETHLDDASADIVTISQALHWMEPEPTFCEIARILRSGGVFGAIDCDWPPVMNPSAEKAYAEFMHAVGALEKRHGDDRVRRWAKSGHLDRIGQSGLFSHTREVLLHKVERGDARRLMGLALTFGGVQSLLKAGVAEVQEPLEKLTRLAEEHLGNELGPWYFGYRVQIGVK